MEHHKIVKRTLCSLVGRTSDFPIFFLSNIHERNPNQKASKQPQITDKRTQKIGCGEKKTPSDGIFLVPLKHSGGGVLDVWF
jgi:hypothetical protein